MLSSRCRSMIATAALLLLASSTYAADSGCKPVYDAYQRQIVTPHHEFDVTTTAALDHGKPRSSEAIVVVDHRYVLVNGKWTAKAYDSKQALQDEKAREASLDTPKATCKYLRDEPVNGEDAAVYSNVNEVVNAQVWISKSRGLPLRQEVDVDIGRSGKSHTSGRTDYANVQPPPGS